MFINHIKNTNNQTDLLSDAGEYSNAVVKTEVLEKYKFIDLFAGIGGFRLGFESEIMECVFSSEWDKYASKTYEANFGEMPFGDVNEVDIKNDIPEFHVMLGGFPCQPFSKIGLGEGFKHKTQGNLFFNILDIIRAKKPVSFVLENVTGLLNHKSDEGKTIDIMLDALTNLGYEVNLGMLNSADFGVPQNRRRIFFVGFDKDVFTKPTGFKFPVPPKIDVFVNEILESDVAGYTISEHLQKAYMYKKDDGKPQVVDMDSEIIVGTLVSTYHKIQRLTGTFVKDGPTGLRLLSETECKRLMGFPDTYIFPVSRTQMYRQLGNAVVVPVVNAISVELLKVLNTHFQIKSDKVLAN
jgi:DNA (cytosine-5)-methyltransferase 1